MMCAVVLIHLDSIAKLHNILIYWYNGCLHDFVSFWKSCLVNITSVQLQPQFCLVHKLQQKCVHPQPDDNQSQLNQSQYLWISQGPAIRKTVKLLISLHQQTCAA